jgi:hypothetical protein
MLWFGGELPSKSRVPWLDWCEQGKSAPATSRKFAGFPRSWLSHARSVGPSETVRIKAIQLVERYDLRAADSLQLAAALEWCEDVPHGRILLTADQKLAEAAILAGFNVRQL